MKLKHITFFILLLILNSCQYTPNKTDKSKSDDNKSTVLKSYYEKSGALKSEMTIKNKKKNGPAKKYYPTGELHTLVNYVDNVKEGEAIWYYKNGHPYRVTKYVNGKKEGIRKIYYENGKLQAEIPYKNNEPIEGLKEYNVKGVLITYYPKIVFDTQNNLLVNNKFILICRMSNNSKNVTFFQEIVTDSNPQKRKIEVQTKNGIAKIEFHIPSLTKIDKEIIIYAHLKSAMGNPYITKKIYKLKVDSN